MKILQSALYLIISLTAMAAQPPVMGWSSWNTYRVNISDSLIRRQADALSELGLDTLGYRFVNIDDGYFGGRDAAGQLIAHPKRFPEGLQPVVDHIHKLGLKAGIYSDAGRNTCGSFWDNDTIGQGVGFYGHDSDDARFFFSRLGFDFIKVDFCGGDPRQNSEQLELSERERYTAIRNAIRETGRDVRLNVCRWAYPGTWVDSVAGSWRISPDIYPSWQSVRSIIERNMYLSAFASPGHYNDMDMLEVGRGMSREEDLTHFAMWCMLSSPLLIGCDLTALSGETLALLRHEELIALNQDPPGLQAYVAVNDADSAFVFVKDLGTRFGNTRAIALYNPSESPRTVTVPFAAIDLGGDVRVRDIIARQDLGSFKGSLSREIPAHGCRIYRLDADRRDERTIYEAETARLNAYHELSDTPGGIPGRIPDARCSGMRMIGGLGSSPGNHIEWHDIHSFDGGEYTITIDCLADSVSAFTLSVNGLDISTVILRPGKEMHTITLNARLNPGINTIRLSNPTGPMPAIDRLAISRL